MSLVGNLEDLGLGDILQIVSLSRKSGVLYLRGEADAEGRRVEGEIIFQNGQVVRATSTEATQNLGDLLVARGVITQQQLDEALTLQRAAGNRDRVGNVLIRHLGVRPERIQEAIRKQTEAIAYAFFRWPRGDFSFELREADGALDKVDIEMRHLVLDSGLNPQFLAMEGTRLKDELRGGRTPDPGVLPVRVRPPAPRPAAAAGPGGPAAARVAVSPPPAAGSPPALNLNGAHGAPAPGEEEALAELSVDASELAEAPARTVPPPAAPRASSPEGPVREASGLAGTPISPAAAGPAAAPAPGPRASPLAPRPRAEAAAAMVDLTQELGLTRGAAFGGPSSRGLGMLRAMISELASPEAHGQITLLILRFAAEMMRRAVLFLAKDTEVVGLGQFGIELPGANPDRVVRGIRIPLGEASVFADVLARRAALKGPLGPGKWDAHLVDALGGHRPSEVFCAPISSGATIAAILYADNAPEETPIGDTEALEIFLAQAGLQMEKALLERKLREMNRADR